MSDDERDNDVESDLEDDEKSIGIDDDSTLLPWADKRAHHNALERKRRDHIKDSFSSLRDSLPYFQGDKVRLVEHSDDSYDVPDKKQKTEKASRAQILKKAADYIQSMRRKNSAHQQDIDDLKRQNKALEDQIDSLEKAKTTGNYAAAAAVIEHCTMTNNKTNNALAGFDGDSDSDDSSDNSDESKDSPRKRVKTNSDVPLRT